MLIVNEAYTSKTVSWTGEINHKLGGRKDGSVVRRTEDGPGPQRRARDIPVRFGRYPLPEATRLRVHCSKPPRLLANLYPTTRQRTLWDNVQQAKLRGLCLRAIARELGIHRNTVHKYALADVDADGEMTRYRRW